MLLDIVASALRPPRRHASARRTPRLECLEDRRLLAVFNPLASAADGQPGSLREDVISADENLQDNHDPPAGRHLSAHGGELRRPGERRGGGGPRPHPRRAHDHHPGPGRRGNDHRRRRARPRLPGHAGREPGDQRLDHPGRCRARLGRGRPPSPTPRAPWAVASSMRVLSSSMASSSRTAQPPVEPAPMGRTIGAPARRERAATPPSAAASSTSAR